ncbi:hypothetical protein ABT150_54075 [Streptomyces mirabilis]|uniref:hypothetical protein n=1 Tax=Streptomyces mirabilis TaxID=68239 RepID=UPI00331EE9FB
MSGRRAGLSALPTIDVATQTEWPQPLLDALHQISDNPDMTPHDLQRQSYELPHTSHNPSPWTAHLTQAIVDRHRAIHVTPDNLPSLTRRPEQPLGPAE